MAACHKHTVAVTERGHLYTWGRNISGQLGHGDFRPRHIPMLVERNTESGFGTSPVVMGACGENHTLVVTHDGALWACGVDTWGSLVSATVQTDIIFSRYRTARFPG